MIKEKKKGSLSKRYASSYDNKDSGGGSKISVMNWRGVDKDIEFFSATQGRNRINIIPYTIKSKNHPLVRRGEFEIGEEDYLMDLFVHRGVGINQASVVCLKQNYGKPCPVCEQMNELKKMGKEKEAGELKASRRVFYNVEDVKNPGKVQIFETSHFLFEKELIDEARDDEEGGFIDFADVRKGKNICFRAQKVKKSNFEFTEFKSFSFQDREDPLDEDLLEEAISFDEILQVPTYEEIEKLLFGEDEEEEDDDVKPTKKASKKVVEEDDEDDFEEEEEKPVKKAPPKKQKNIPIDDEEEEEDWDDIEDEESVKKPAKKPTKKVEEEDDDWDDEEEDEPVKKKAPPKKAPTKKVEEEDDWDDDDW